MPDFFFQIFLAVYLVSKQFQIQSRPAGSVRQIWMSGPVRPGNSYAQSGRALLSTKRSFLAKYVKLQRTKIWLYLINVSRVMEFWFWVVLKIHILQVNCCILWIDLMPGSQNVPKLYVLSKSIFYVKNKCFFFHFLHTIISILDTVSC